MLGASSYSRSAVDTFLDLLGLVAFILLVIVAAAAVTAAVVKISPTRRSAKQQN
jgi:hypothetical protein